MNEPSIGVSVGGVAPMTRSLNPGGSMRPGSVDGNAHTSHPKLGDYTLHCEGAPELLFTENETNNRRLWGRPNPAP